MKKYKGTFYAKHKYADGINRQTLFSVTVEAATARRGRIVEVHSIKQVEKPQDNPDKHEINSIKGAITGASKNLKSFYTLKEI